MMGSGRILAGMLMLCGLVGPAAAEPARSFDAAAIPFLSSKSRAELARYPELPTPKALAISPAGTYAFGANGAKNRTAEDVQRAALQYCQFVNREPCALYAVDDAVVLPSGAAFRPLPVEIVGSGRFDPATVPFVSDPMRTAGMVTYQRSRGQKALALTPAGAWAAVWDKATEEEARRGALQRCKEQGSKADCILYAVNDTIVFDEER